MKKNITIIMLTIFVSIYELSVQTSFLGFDQPQCHLLENSPYAYYSTTYGKHNCPAYIITKNGIGVYNTVGGSNDNNPSWIYDLLFINASTGFSTTGGIFNSLYVEKTMDYGKKWNVLGAVSSSTFLGTYIVNINTAFLINHIG